MENVIITIPNETDIQNWNVTVLGPTNTPYQNGSFELSFQFPTEYPFKPPTITFSTKVYHPNISSSTGEICASIINDSWGPTLNVKWCIETILNMLSNPSSDSPLEEEIAQLLREKPSEFEKTAKKWTKDYAM